MDFTADDHAEAAARIRDRLRDELGPPLRCDAIWEGEEEHSTAERCGSTTGVELAAFVCPCGHSGQRTICMEHAFLLDNAYCLRCNSEGHYCPITITVALGFA